MKIFGKEKPDRRNPKVFFAFQDIKIRTKLLLLVCTTIVFFVGVVGIATFKKVERIVNDESGKYIKAILSQVNNDINNRISIAETSLNSFFSGGTLNSLINMEQEQFGSEEDFLMEIKKQVLAYKILNNSATDMRIFIISSRFMSSDTSVFSAEHLERYSWYNKITTINSDNRIFYWTNVGDSTWNKFGYISAVYCYTTLYNQDTSKPVAIVRTDFVSNDIFEPVDLVEYGRNGEVFVANKNGSIVYYNKSNDAKLEDFKKIASAVISKEQEEGSFRIKVNQTERFIVFTKKNSLDWYIIGTSPYEDIKEKAISIRDFIGYLSLFVFILALIAAYLLSRIFTKKITELSHTINKFGKDNFDLNFDTYGNDEIGQLASQFKLMLIRIKDLVLEVENQHRKEKALLNEKYELEVMKKQAELWALQNQINPHFLFNTLEMIKGLLYSEEPNKNIINATQSLSEMFKYNLNSNYIVQVKDEIEHIRNYITIQNLRFDDNVELEIQMNKSSLNAKIVRFTFEPIIENCVKHGFNRKRGSYRIKITSQVNEKTIIIKITDNGNGIKENELEKINKQLTTSILKNKIVNGIGIFNVNERIKKHFGKQYGLRVLSKLNQGTTVEIYLPNSQRE